MADSKNSKISELVELVDPSNADYIPIVDTANQETKKISYTSLVAALNEDDDSYSKTESDALIAAVQADVDQNEADADAAIAAVQADVDQNEADADAAIAAVQADVNQNEADADAAIAAVQADVNQNEADADAAIAAVQADVDQNEADADAAIAANTLSIATNTANIATNTANIATNAANISSNDTDIATNAANIATNAANIATNAANIAINTSNIQDYQFGTFNPTLALVTGSTTYNQSTYATRLGYYVKFGKVVFVNFRIKITDPDIAVINAPQTSSFAIINMPYPALTSGFSPDINIRPRRGWQNLGAESYMGVIYDNYMYFYKNKAQGGGAGVGWNLSNLTPSDFSLNPFNFVESSDKAFSFFGSGTYITDDD
jgi:hypothetical protein